MKELPGNADFKTIRDRGLLYVDKTGYIRELLRRRQCDYFLGRPPRFGKTLLIDTLETLFTGDRGYFKGLLIDQSDYAFNKHPTVSLKLSFERCGPDRLRELIIARLRSIARTNGVEVGGSDPCEYMGNLIMALHGRFGAEVAVLVDDYDAPAMGLLDDLETAKANAEAVNAILARISRRDVGRCVRFTMVAGTARIESASIASEPNHLKDVTFHREYGGICGFTEGELDAFFGDRMAPALASLKRAGVLGPSSGVGELRDLIVDWYGGYNWGGAERVLNPLSVIRFFETLKFDKHWLDSGGSVDLATQMRRTPKDFLKIYFYPYDRINLCLTGLEHIQSHISLLKNGYLSIDRCVYIPIFNFIKQKEILEYRYYLKYPNREIASSYLSEYFKALLNLDSDDGLAQIAEELKTAFLAKDARAVGGKFNDGFSCYTHRQRLDNGEILQFAVEAFLRSLNLKVHDGPPGPKGRPASLVELGDRVFVSIGSKLVPSPPGLAREEEIRALATLAKMRLPYADVDKLMAGLAVDKLGEDFAASVAGGCPDGPERNALLADMAFKALSRAEIDVFLASQARRRLPEDVVVAGLNFHSPGAYLPEKRVDAILAAAADEAWRDLAGWDRRSMARLKATRIIRMGLALHGNRVGVRFGPDIPPYAPPKMPRSKATAAKSPRRG